jgi:hypothetical protein
MLCIAPTGLLRLDVALAAFLENNCLRCYLQFRGAAQRNYLMLIFKRPRVAAPVVDPRIWAMPTEIQRRLGPDRASGPPVHSPQD